MNSEKNAVVSASVATLREETVRICIWIYVYRGGAQVEKNCIQGKKRKQAINEQELGKQAAKKYPKKWRRFILIRLQRCSQLIGVSGVSLSVKLDGYHYHCRSLVDQATGHFSRVMVLQRRDIFCSKCCPLYFCISRFLFSNRLRPTR